jgi:hypothetical protein
MLAAQRRTATVGNVPPGTCSGSERRGAHGQSRAEEELPGLGQQRGRFGGRDPGRFIDRGREDNSRRADRCFRNQQSGHAAGRGEINGVFDGTTTRRTMGIDRALRITGGLLAAIAFRAEQAGLLEEAMASRRQIDHGQRQCDDGFPAAHRVTSSIFNASRKSRGAQTNGFLNDE